MNELEQNILKETGSSTTLIETLNTFQTASSDVYKFVTDEKTMQQKETILGKLVFLIQDQENKLTNEELYQVYDTMRILLRDKPGNNIVNKPTFLKPMITFVFNPENEIKIREITLRCLINTLFENIPAQNIFLEEGGFVKLLDNLSDTQLPPSYRSHLGRLLFHFTRLHGYMESFKDLGMSKVLGRLAEECVPVPEKRIILSSVLLVLLNWIRQVVQRHKEAKQTSNLQDKDEKDDTPTELIVRWWNNFLEGIVLLPSENEQSLEFDLKMKVVSILFYMPIDCVQYFEGKTDQVLKVFGEILVYQLKQCSPTPLSEEEWKKKKKLQKKAKKKKNQELIEKWIKENNSKEELTLKEFLKISSQIKQKIQNMQSEENKEEIEKKKQKQEEEIKNFEKNQNTLLPILIVINKIMELSSDARDHYTSIVFNDEDSSIRQMLNHHLYSNCAPIIYYISQFYYFLFDESLIFFSTFIGWEKSKKIIKKSKSN
ncbi:synembryn [Anaeramoeba flamelloides]|uniref:Synembryn n=1 Tax=Anaeramoeba flamelloides TaxID=1746091 RepID=A0ABQ8Y5G2_9EUKA|nr:synembryn [Anaeramoeba flamelloides]